MTRRATLLWSLATIAGAAVPPAAAAPTVHAFAPSAQAMTMTRTVWRSLADGREIKVERTFRIEIAPEGGGYRVSGRQIAVTVEAPAPLAMLADVERGRDASGLFPLHLDSSGRIAAGTAAPQRASSDHSAALHAARAVLAAATPGKPDRADEIRFVAALASAGAPNRWPADLFSAPAGARSDTRAIALPDGSQGEVTVTVTAAPALPGGVPREVLREVRTRLGTTVRTSRERWAFALAAPIAGP